MDSATEATLLKLIEERRGVVVSKENTKEMRQARTNAWENIKYCFLIETGLDVTVQQLQKKWNNIQNRVKERIRDTRRTGGGPVKPLTNENDATCLRIIGESNPKMTKIPGAYSNTTPLSSGSFLSHSEDLEEEETTNTENCTIQRTVGTSLKKAPRRRLAQDAVEELHREVLLLQKEKLTLKIAILRFMYSAG